MPEAWNMFIQAPIMGWGPGNHIIELGSRFGRKPLDTHNGYLWVLTETGLAGQSPISLPYGSVCALPGERAMVLKGRSH